MLWWSTSAQLSNSLLWNHSWISLWAPSTESLAWTTFLCQATGVLTSVCALRVPGTVCGGRGGTYSGELGSLA